jgi:tRNA pseudouridine38-40 synthase
VTARLLIEYDGGGFAGWARQPGERTVRGVLEEGLERVLQRQVELTAAGRTDAGVHALGQVASHLGEPAPARAINGVLPDDLRVVESEAIPGGFNARRDALSRTYRYRLYTREALNPFENGRSLHWTHVLDRDAVRACARALPGKHDFTAFTPTETDHVRFERVVLSASWGEAGPALLEFRIEADAFMRNMIRVLVGTMLEVGGGRRSVRAFGALLRGRPRAEAGATAPPHGLHFLGAGYERLRVL